MLPPILSKIETKHITILYESYMNQQHVGLYKEYDFIFVRYSCKTSIDAWKYTNEMILFASFSVFQKACDVIYKI